jgi:hypothetical protein
METINRENTAMIFAAVAMTFLALVTVDVLAGRTRR